MGCGNGHTIGMQSWFASRLCLILTGCWWFMLGGATQAINGPLSATVARQMGADPKGAAGEAGAWFFVSSTVAVVLCTLLGARLNRVILIRVGGVGLCVAAVAATLTNVWSVYLALLAVLGAAYALLSVWINGEFSEEFKIGKDLIWMQIVNGFWGVGALLGPRVVAETLPNIRVPHQAIWVMAVIGLPLALFVRRGPTKNQEGETTAPSLVTITQLLPLAFVLGIYVAAEVGTSMLMAFHMTETFRVTDSFAARVVSDMFLSFTAGRMLLSGVSAVMNPKTLVLVTSICAIVALVLATQPWAFRLGYILFGLSLAPIFPSVIAWSASVNGPGQRNASVLVFSGCIAAAAAPIIGNVLFKNAPQNVPYLGMVSLALLAVLAMSIRPAASEATS